MPLAGDVILQAIKCLKASGEKSFEKLTAILLSRLIGLPVRLCKAGYQAGADALAEIPIAIEDKRYQAPPLDRNELQGKLTDAAQTHRELELWVLVTTVALDALSRDALKKTAELLGLAVLILDDTAAEPELPDVASIVALCAINFEQTLRALRSQDWLDSKLAANLPAITSIEADLKAIRAMPRFTEWVDRLRMTLTNLPLWQLVTRRQNHRLAKILEKDAGIIFGTAFDSSKVVRRSAKKQLDEWVESALNSSAPEVAVMVGERYDGKTWCAFDWMEESLKAMPVPVFFLGSNRGINSAKSLHEHILDDITQVLGSFERHAEALIQRQSCAEIGSTPWCVIIMDGLNEYGQNPRKWLEHLAWASGRITLDSRPCAVLTTVRERSWRELASWVKDPTRLVRIEPYDDIEFRAALDLKGFPSDYLESIPEAARAMVRRPRYFELVIEHRDRLGQYDAITPDVLHWLDACDKISRSKLPVAGWDEKHFQGVLKELAARYSEQGILRLSEVRSTIGDFSTDIAGVLSDLQSEGVLEEASTGYKVVGERLALGMGLYIVEELCVADEQGSSLVERLRDFLSPLQETEEIISWVRAATVVALISAPGNPKGVIDALVSEWLRARNLSSRDFEEVRAIRHLLLRPLLRLAPETWSIERGDPRLQELSRMIFDDALPIHRDLIGKAVANWFHCVPTAGAPIFQQVKEHPEAAVHAGVTDPEIDDLNLNICGDAGILMLHRVGLYLVGKAPDLVGPDDLLALTAAEEISGDHRNDGDRFVMRRSLAQVDGGWFEKQVDRLSRNLDGRRRKILFWLIARAERADLRAFEEATKPPPDLEWERWIEQSAFNRDRYDKVHAQPFAAGESPTRFIELACEVVRAPELPKPCNERMTVIGDRLRDDFSNVELMSSTFSASEDIRFERMLPAAAAWVPDIAATIIRRQLGSLPTRPMEKRRGWIHRLHQDVVLADGAVLTALRELLGAPLQNDEERHMVGRVLRALLPSMRPLERIEALMHHPLGSFEWRDLYLLVADMMDAKDTTHALTCIYTEADPLHLRRLLYLFREIRNLTLTKSDIDTLVDLIANGCDEDRVSALAVAVTGRVKSIPLEVLLPLTTGTPAPRSLIPQYATWLLAQSDALMSAPYDKLAAWLPAPWRAVAASKCMDWAEALLQEVEQALCALPATSSATTSGEATLAAPVVVETVAEGDLLPQIKLDPAVLSRTMDLRSLASTTGGIGRLSSDAAAALTEIMEGGEAITARWERLSKQVSTELLRRRNEHRTCWSSHEFPQSLVDQMYAQKRAQFEKWLDLLLGDKPRARYWWGGLLKPMFRRAIRAGSQRTIDVWPLVFPFQRDPLPTGVRFSNDGIDWVFHELSHPAADSDIAIQLLIDVVERAQSDWELLQIALGARCQGQARLIKVVKTLFASPDPEKRARGIRIAGWLEGMSAEVAQAKESDPSLWVRRVAAMALKSERVETWAHRWLDIFINGGNQEVRWGAGQLFLACVDSRFTVWAWSMIKQSGLPGRLRGEAILLLDAAKTFSDKEDRKLRETFLLHKLGDLRAVCHPWHPTVGWEDLATAG